VALNLPSYQSSLYIDDFSNYDAYRANDGRILQKHYTQCAASQENENPWWAVDLGVPLSVQEIFFTNRGDGSGMFANT